MAKTRYQLHLDRWGVKGVGCGSELCPTARNVVLARGRLPSDITFTGEAPGESENLRGSPFIGPAGQLLDEIIERAGLTQYRLSWTNLVGCIPRDPEGGKLREPDEASIRCCAPRLREFLLEMAKPVILVRVGQVAKRWLNPAYPRSVWGKGVNRPYKHDSELPFRVVDIEHPASIIRDTVARRGIKVQRCVVTLAAAADEYIEAPGSQEQRT
jgi:uracil-DNA glycosylase family 4